MKMRRIRRYPASLALVTAATVMLVACRPYLDVAAGVKIEELGSGWVPVKGHPGRSKLVPAISFRLRNVSDASLAVLQVNAIFHRGTDEAEWGNAFQTAAGSEGLAAGATSRFVLLASSTGYTGANAPADLIENSRFVDARVELFGRYGSAPWTRLGEFAIARVLLNP